jgi:hypothetical protein
MSVRRAAIGGLVIAVVLGLLAAGLLITAYGYNRLSGLFPIFVGWVFLALVLLEVAVSARALHRAPVRGSEKREPVDWRNEIGGSLWLMLLLALIGVAGFVVGAPVFMLTYLVVAGQRRVAGSAIIAAGALAFIWVVFIWLLDYRLYGGLLFGA